MMKRVSSTSTRVFEAMLERIRSGQWPVGALVPGERVLVEQFGVSRIALREALSMLRAMGVIETNHGRGIQGVPNRRHHLESAGSPDDLSGGRTAFCAGLRGAPGCRIALRLPRRPADAPTSKVDRLQELLLTCRDQMEGGAMEAAIATDMEFHMEIVAGRRTVRFSHSC